MKFYDKNETRLEVSEKKKIVYYPDINVSKEFVIEIYFEGSNITLCYEAEDERDDDLYKLDLLTNNVERNHFTDYKDESSSRRKTLIGELRDELDRYESMDDIDPDNVSKIAGLARDLIDAINDIDGDDGDA